MRSLRRHACVVAEHFALQTKSITKLFRILTFGFSVHKVKEAYNDSVRNINARPQKTAVASTGSATVGALNMATGVRAH